MAFRQQVVRLHHDEQNAHQWPRQSHHAGDLEDCSRKLFYLWKDYEIDNPSRNGMTLTMGRANEVFVEEVLSAKLGHYERDYRIEVPVGTRKVVGKIDFYMTFDDWVWADFFKAYPRHAIPIEVKSMNSKRYEEQITKGPQDKHVSQLNAYVCATEAPFGLLMYVQREATEEIPFTFWLAHPDLARFNWTQRRLARLNAALDNGVVPPPQCKEKKLDPYCPYMKIRCPKDGGWPIKLCKTCGDPMVNIEDHADCIFGGGSE